MAFEDVAYFNFELNNALSERFRSSLEPQKLLLELGVINGRSIRPGKTLIIFDEIQFCGKAMTSLKYFYEMAPEYALVCAGSFMGIAGATPPPTQ